ncbi:serine hydrolase domain-containing protein [Porphyrobacter sp. AAP60]|uniref:serine hydrolase domain-containing protein n=1 Tax=Porphyrobacter sp. AAP60 TaxID=1523423 RepID=UPI0006B8A29D|nr:serine hydrolase [Porphyrobacter sp. AAP60]KPF64499.1 serine hydrolase [Porphyrobacter sp. AAP60]
MIRTALAAATLLLAVPATSQNQQQRLDARYDRTLAAGYKALMLCGAIANAEANGVIRSPESVAQWELTGIQAPLDAIIPDLPFEIVRRPTGQIAHVAVHWAEDLPARVAAYSGTQTGCAILPIGAPENGGNPGQPVTRAERPAPPARGKIIDAGDQRTGRKPVARQIPSVDRVQKAALAGGYGEGSRTTAVLVSRASPGGRRSSAFFAPGFDDKTPQRTWSVAKSIAATLVGAAVFRGEADVSASAGLGGAVADPRRAITIDHLLRMGSGRYSDTPGNRTDPLYWGGATVEEVALDWPLIAAPGSTYRYANNDTLAAVAAIKPSFAAHPPAEFFAKIGMNRTVAETDWQGNYILSSQVWTTAGDLAKFGQLYLNDGKLPSGERILPEGWVKYVSTPSGPQPDGPFGYGAGFWLLNKSEGVPPDTFAAFGNRGQYVVIVPSRDVVIVRRGEDPVGASFDIAAFTRDVLAALGSE